jgi:membrane protease YdiL (CAAX protease family)
VNDLNPEQGLSGEPAAEVSAPVECWRCGLPTDALAEVCPHCQARLTPAAPSIGPRLSPVGHPLHKVFVAYAVMLAFSLVWGLVLHVNGHLTEGDLQVGTLILEGLDTVLVLIAAIAVGRLSVPRPTVGVRVAACLTAPLALAFVLAVNVGYRWALTAFLRPVWLASPTLEPEWSLVTVLMFAVQPAVIEEWFFRHLALGALRTATGTHAAVWVSAVMFAMAHVYNPLGLPWLLVAGVVFGYWRVASGGLAIPVLLHFAHNVAMLWFQDFV